MRATQKFSGTVLVDPGPVLRGEMVTDYESPKHDGRYREHAVLSFGDHELARWDVTDRFDEWGEQPGDYLSPDEAEARKEEFVEKFVGEKLKAVFGGLDGALPPP